MPRNILTSYDFKTAITVQGLASFNANISAFGTSTFWANQQLSLAVRNGQNAVTNLVEYSVNAGTVLGGTTTNGLLWTGTTSAPTLGHVYTLTGASFVSSTQATFTSSIVRSVNPYAVGQKIVVAGVTGGTYNGSWIVTAIGGSSGAWTATVTAPSGTTPFTNTAGTGGTGSIESAAFIRSLSSGSAPLTLQLAGASGTSTDFLRMYDGSNNLRTYFSGAGDLVVPAISASWSITSSAQDVTVNAMRTRTSLASGYRANLQTWESSSTVLAGMTSAGKFFTGSTTGINTAVGGTIQSIATGANPLVTMASAHGLAVGDVVVLAGTTGGTYNGVFFVATTPASTTFTITSALTAGQAAAGGTVSVGAQVAITARSAGIIGQVIQGAVSQTADLIRAQNSSATVTFGVDSIGSVFTAAIMGMDRSNAILLGSSRNVGLNAGSANYAGGAAVTFIGNATTAPTSNPTGGGILYVNAGALTYRGTGGSAVTIVNANGTTPYPTLTANNTFTGVQAFNNAVNIGGGSVGSVGLEIGSVLGSATTPFIDFHSSATTTTDFDSRIIASGGTGTNGAGTLTYTAATNTFTGSVNTAFGLALTGTTSPITLNGSVGTSGQVLTSAGAGATPTWTTVSGGGSFTGGTLTSGLVLATGTTTLQPLKFVAGTNLTTPVTGVKEYDGTVFYSTSNTNPGRALETQSYYYVSNSDFYIDFSGSGASQSMFGGPTTGLTVAAGTTYEFELDAAVQHQYQVNAGITGTFAMQNTGGATVAVTNFIDYGSNTTGFTTATTMSSIRNTAGVTFMTAISSGSRYGIIKVRGILRVTGSGTTKVYPGLAASSTNDNTWIVASGAVFKMTPIGNGTVTTVGAWA